MQPNSEPSAADVAMVAAAMGDAPPAAPTPAPAPAPAPQQQPAPVTPQPAPTQQPNVPATPAPAAPTEPTDPFTSLFAQPTEPTAPQAPAQPTQPTEPQNPQPQQPTEPTQPAQPAQPQQPAQPTSPTTGYPVVSPDAATDDYQSFDDYMKQATAGIPEVPQAPDADKIDPNDPAAIKSFFDGLVETAVARSKAENARSEAIQRTERTLWEGAFTKYGSLRDNKGLRDMVHSIRMGYFQRGQAITPTQAADKLLTAMQAQYQRGVADNQVTTTIEQVQPTGGGSGVPVPTSMDTDSTLLAVQTGGEQALAQILDQEIKNGRTW